jgi:cholesterol oxidase
MVIGSGFGGSVAAFRTAQNGYRVGVMESGKRWNDEDLPNPNWNLTHFLWQPEIEMYGIQRLEYLDDVLMLSGAGGGRRVSRLRQHVVRPAQAFFGVPEWAGSPTR